MVSDAETMAEIESNALLAGALLGKLPREQAQSQKKFCSSNIDKKLFVIRTPVGMLKPFSVDKVSC